MQRVLPFSCVAQESVWQKKGVGKCVWNAKSNKMQFYDAREQSQLFRSKDLPKTRHTRQKNVYESENKQV